MSEDTNSRSFKGFSELTSLEKITEVGTGLWNVVGKPTKYLIAGPILYGAIGGLGGEIIDNLPYLSEAIPEGIERLRRILDGDHKYFYLEGNLDKIGAVVGFVSGYFVMRPKK